jgi:hypothetical protein
MAASITIDDREFQAALKAYMKVSRRSLAEIVNKRAVNIAFKSIKHTPAAGKRDINSELRSKSKRAPKQSLARLRVIVINRKRDKEIPKGKDLTAAANEVIKNRKKSIGYIKAGWLSAVQALQPHAKLRKRPPRLNDDGDATKLGYGKPARSGLNPTAIIANQVAGAVEVGSKAIQRAMQEDALDMRTFTAKRMQQDAKKFNA